MINFKKGIIIFAISIFIGHLLLIDYSDMTWTINASSYLGIVAMILLIISMILSIRNDTTNEPDHKK